EPKRYKDEGPQHRVTIPAPFAVGKYEVTRGQYAAFVRATSRDDGDGCYVRAGGKWQKDSSGSWRNPGFQQGDDHPVACVNWDDAKSYVAWLSEKTGQNYRLLTEAEWEYVARAGTTTPFSTGARITPEQANFDGNYTYNGSARGVYRQRTTTVGSFRPNAFGLYDVHGNVWEWVEDCWHGSYQGAPSDGNAWTTGGECGRRVLRGGSWVSGPGFLRSAIRFRVRTGSRNSNYGFRLARTLSR
ncbi:MAG: formylglycine-generating enzyme family protein, partial [Alphaproteobacteria bacterium]|nr:formylglycine-generating enzyme family protein [Alphaproteobacteria bacterium]